MQFFFQIKFNNATHYSNKINSKRQNIKVFLFNCHKIPFLLFDIENENASTVNILNIKKNLQFNA